MIAMERGIKVRGVLFALALLGVTGVNPATAQTFKSKKKGATPAADPTTAARPSLPQTPILKEVRVPVNPTDPIAIINDEVITRARLADECVARKGEEILQTLIARTLIDQALRAKKLDVTAAEIDAEIDNVAMRVGGIGRDAWLRTLDKERGISPAQYARDIIYPALALRKLAAPKVQVTPDDLRKSFEAQYGDKLRVRMIMVDKVQTAKELWEKLKDNPGGFEKLAMERSMDSGSRSLGGLLAEPISRHAYPETVSNAAFRQLVDGDPTDKDKTHKPKNGDVTGPIQVDEAVWILLRRENLIPAQPIDPKDEKVKKGVHDMIYEVKLKEAMGELMVDLMRAAKIENVLTGETKMANQAMDVDQEVKLMGGKPNAANTNTTSVRPSSGSADTKASVPAGLSQDAVQEAKSLTRPLK